MYHITHLVVYELDIFDFFFYTNPKTRVLRYPTRAQGIRY